MTLQLSSTEPDVSPEVPSARIEAFCSADAPEIFESVVHAPQIWQASPFDIESIHAAAREMFGTLLRRASAVTAPSAGRALLLLGEAGSGKTHLLQAFRNLTHANGSGYFGYLQMTSETGNYARYVLRNLITSLDEPYSPPAVSTSGLARLSTALFDAIPDLSDVDREVFQTCGWTQLPVMVHQFADRLVCDAKFAGCDEDLIRALIFIQRDDPRIKARAMKWLRCEDLSSHDRVALGDLVPRNQDEDAIGMIVQLGRLMYTLQNAALVICVDQLEDVFTQDTPTDRFRRAIDALVALSEQVPTAVIVIACLEDYYKTNRQLLPRPKLDRLEFDPEPIRLKTARNQEEIEAILGRRLAFLFEEVGLSPEDGSTYPYQPQDLAQLVGRSARKVLDECRSHHQRCIMAGRWIAPFGEDGSPVRLVEDAAAEQPNADLDQAWNDFKNLPVSVPDEEPALAKLLAGGIERCNRELPDGIQFIMHEAGQWLFPWR